MVIYKKLVFADFFKAPLVLNYELVTHIHKQICFFGLVHACDRSFDPVIATMILHLLSRVVIVIRLQLHIMYGT